MLLRPVALTQISITCYILIPSSVKHYTHNQSRLQIYVIDVVDRKQSYDIPTMYIVDIVDKPLRMYHKFIRIG